MVFALGTQKKVIAFKYSWILDPMYSAGASEWLRCRTSWWARLTHARSSASLRSKETTQLGLTATHFTNFTQSNCCAIYRTL